MITAENIFAGNIQEATFSMREGSQKFFRNSELPGKLIRVSESSPPRQVKNEVRAMKALIEVFEERYGIATVKPEYVIGPGNVEGEACAFFICDEILHGRPADTVLEEDGYAESLDQLNNVFISHTTDVRNEGGLFNTEIMHLSQYLMSGDTPVLVDAEPQFSCIMPPPEDRLYGDSEKVPIIHMMETIVYNAVLLSRAAGHRTPSSMNAELFLNELHLYEAPIQRARQTLLNALKKNSILDLEHFFDPDADLPWQSLQYARSSRVYAADL